MRKHWRPVALLLVGLTVLVATTGCEDDDDDDKTTVVVQNGSSGTGTTTPLVQPAPTQAPVLVSPKNNLIVFVPTTLEFNWKNVPDATEYDVSIIGAVWALHTVTKSELKFQVTQPGEYFWTVRAKSPGGEGPISETWKVSAIKFIDINI